MCMMRCVVGCIETQVVRNERIFGDGDKRLVLDLSLRRSTERREETSPQKVYLARHVDLHVVLYACGS